MDTVIEGHPKLKKLIDEENLKFWIMTLINVSELKLDNLLNGKDDDGFTLNQAILICTHLRINPDDYFF